MASGTDLGIVIPAYRPDPERLENYVTELDESLDPSVIRIELDEPTPEIHRRLQRSDAVVNSCKFRRGKGAAITAGFDALETPLRAFVDADGSTPPESLERIVEVVRSERANLAVGSRRHPKSTVPIHQTRVRRYLGDGFAWIARRMLPVALYDYQCGAKVIDEETWKAIRGELMIPGFAWDIDLISTAAIHGATLVEVPITWVDQPGTTVDPIPAGTEFAAALFRARRRANGNRSLSSLIGTRSAPLIDRPEIYGGTTHGETP